MACKFGFFIVLFLSQRLRKVYGSLSQVPEPCLRSIINDSTIGTMCSASYGEELTNDGPFKKDNVILRVITQQENCICNVTINNQVDNETLYLRKHDGNNKSAPENDSCGLAVDIRYIPYGPAIQPIVCTKPIQTTTIQLNKGHMLQLESRLIDGDFTRGYCMEIIRKHRSDTGLSLEISCSDAPPKKHTTTTVMTTSVSTPPIRSRPPVTTEKRITERQVTTTNLPSTIGKIPTTQITATTDSTTHMLNQTDSQTNSKEKKDILYIAIGIGAAVLLLAVILFLIFRGKSKRDKRKFKPDGNKQDNNDSDEDGLKDNILYKSFDQHTNNQNSKEQTPLTKTCADTFDDYSEIDDTSHTRQHEVTGKSHITTDHYNTIEINSSQPDNKLIRIEDNHSSISETDPRKSHDSTSQPEQTYAVVDKSGKQSNSNERKPRPIEPLDTYGVVDKSRKNTNLVDRKNESIELNKHDAIITSGDNNSSDLHTSDDIKTPEYAAENTDFIAGQSSDYDEIELKFDT